MDHMIQMTSISHSFKNEPKDLLNMDIYIPNNSMMSTSNGNEIFQFTPKNKNAMIDQSGDTIKKDNFFEFTNDLPVSTNTDLSNLPEFIPRSSLMYSDKTDWSSAVYTNSKKSPLITFQQDLSVAVPEFVPRNSRNKTNKNKVIPVINENSEEAAEKFYSVTPEDPNDTSSVTTYQENVNGTVYFYTAPVTSETTSPDAEGESTNNESISLFPGAPVNLRYKSTSLGSSATYYVQEDLRHEIFSKNALILMEPNPNIFPNLPERVNNYSELVPLEPMPATSSNSYTLVTSTYKATHIKSGVRYCLRRIHGMCLPSTKCNNIADSWKKVNHTNLVQLKDMFTTREFGDNSIVFVYDYYPNSETLLSKHFPSQVEGVNEFSVMFSSDPSAPRPYSHTKNAMLRQQHSNSILPESTLWSYAIQLTGALRVIHGAGLSCRCINATKVIITGRNRVRINGTCVSDVTLYDPSIANRLTMMSHFQQDDLFALGELLLALACGSLIATRKENMQTSLELMSRTYSTDFRRLVTYLLSSQRRSILELMPMIGARFYSQIDAMQLRCDILENEISKEMDNGRLLKLVIKLAIMNERNGLDTDTEYMNGDKYMLMLFCDYLYNQMAEDRRPWIDMAHIIHSLNKMDVGSSEKLYLMPREEDAVALVTTYDDLKQCFERAFNELSKKAAYISEDREKTENNNEQ